MNTLVNTDTIGLIDGKEIKRFQLKNKNGLCVEVLELGAILAKVETPDRHGVIADLVLGYDTIEQWFENPHYFSALCGRVANRISGAKFSIDDQEYSLAINNDPHGIPSALHGGLKGFSKYIWQGEGFQREGAEGVTLKLSSPAGEEGYPGKLDVELTYTLTDNDELVMNIKATTDAPTIVNLINHTYWNLSGEAGSSILDHSLEIPSSFYLPSGLGMIPTGELRDVSNTPFDFRVMTTLGKRISDKNECLEIGKGYDHCYKLKQNDDLTLAARLHDPKSGRLLEISTNQHGIQIYTGNYLDIEDEGKDGASYPENSGIALESGNFPNAINTPNFPSPILRPGETYRHKVVHRFSVK